ncbi:MAG: serine hydroxymethyltransferase [Candidatus Vogelbacteria bacterium]|nr:serine hydroxymethyltransferase [Candidatus Vogelbacteria bacterium]
MKDRQIEKLIKKEKEHSKNVINLIASENYVSSDVLTALGSILTNKYAEGYPGARYYGGNVIIDEIENLCKKRALEVFGLSRDKWAVNVQPLSGSPANVAVYLALVPIGSPSTGLEVGKIMGMTLAHGGHLTHGHKVSITGKFWRQIPYGVSKETETLDFNELGEIAKKEKPNIIVAGFTAYPRLIDFKKFRELADSVGAYLMVDMSHFAGLVAGGVYPSPFEYADIVTTTTHKTLRGPRSAMIFSKIDGRLLPAKIDKAVFPGIQGGPHINQIAAVAVALKEVSKSDFKRYAKQIVKNANILAMELARLGWRIISGGTDTHLILVDTWNGGVGIGGKEASEKLEKAGIIVNKNTIPFDTRTPVDPSGIRIGTAGETTRRKKEKDMIKIAHKIDFVLRT